VAITTGADRVRVGHTAHCIILGVKARFEAEIILDYEMLQVPVGGSFRGCVVDFMCSIQQRVEQTEATGAAELPLLNEQVAMENREVISEPLYSGIKVLHLSCFPAISFTPFASWLLSQTFFSVRFPGRQEIQPTGLDSPQCDRARPSSRSPCRRHTKPY
jgi:hypothetical protein